MLGHDGVVINLLQRVDDSYDDQPPFGTMSNINNATQVVRDYERAYDFFTNKLGWGVRWEASPVWNADGANNMSLPNSLLISGVVNERAASLDMDPERDGGTIEIFNFEGITGIDFSERAYPPNRGVLMYVVHVAGLCDYLSTVAARGVQRSGSSCQLRPRCRRQNWEPRGTFSCLITTRDAKLESDARDHTGLWLLLRWPMAGCLANNQHNREQEHSQSKNDHPFHVRFPQYRQCDDRRCGLSRVWCR